MKTFLQTIVILAVGAAAGWFGHDLYNNEDGGSGADTLVLSGEKSVIEKTLTDQSAAWSAGDIDRFMQDYWMSQDLRFASGGVVKRGWQTTIERYKLRYPDKTAMGGLSFTDLEINLLSGVDALVFGRWTLSRAQDAPTGLFTLHMKKFDDDWKIVSDHTSSAELAGE